MENNNLKNARTLTQIGAIVGIIVGVCWVLTGFGIIWGVADVIGGIILLKYKKYTDKEFIEKRSTILIWGIVFLLTSIIGGVLLLIAYFQSDINIQQEAEETEFMGFMNL